MKIEKSYGSTPTEKFLSSLCENTFLKIWSYPNLYKKKGDELCDLLAVFENHIFIFQDKNISFSEGKSIDLAWERWSRRAIEEQIKQLNRAKNWIINYPDKIFLDAKCTKPFPVKIPSENVYIHKILIAHGAKEVCEKSYDGNAPPSLAICYGEKFPDQSYPFLLYLDNKDPIHVFDSFNLEIILSELDTFYDFKGYLVTKEYAIKKLKYLAYHGEENLLGYYFNNFDEQKNKYSIEINDKKVDGVLIADDKVWKNLINSAPYFRRKEANKISYLLWDKFIQTTCQNALDGILLGNGNIFNGKSAVYEMAKEPRFTRRALSDHMLGAIKKFPDADKITSYVSFMPSFYPEKLTYFCSSISLILLIMTLIAQFGSVC